jgi:hypothetical protein
MRTDNNVIRCRASLGAQLTPSQPWKPDSPVSFVFCPSGVHNITAGFRDNESVTICVDVSEGTEKVLQASFDEMAGGTMQQPFSDEDHQGRKATIRFPAGKTFFEWGQIRGTEGVIIHGGIPTSYGCESVNGRVYTSWSPEFATDADFDNAKRDARGHWSFPAFVRGSETNPAKITGVNFVVGALTNKPAFRAMPMVKARQANPAPQTADEILARLAERRDAAMRLASKLIAQQQGE